MMPYRPIHSQNRVEYIKQKFESSISDENKVVSLKCSKTTVPFKTQLFQNSIELKSSKTVPERNKSKTENVEPAIANKTDGKALIKRTPAFRREKLGCAKSLTKISCQNTEDAQIQKNCEKTNDVQRKGSTENLDGNLFKALQRSKTDINLLKYCDNRSNQSEETLKNGLILSKPILDKTYPKNNQLIEQKKLDEYSVVNKNGKKNNKQHKDEVELKLSESIRRALQLPLPKGPPPKKPPRTFCHVPQSSNENPNSHSKSITSKTDIPKLKSKLEKLEKVIRDHKIGTLNAVTKEDFKNDLEKKLGKIPEMTEGTLKMGVSNKKVDSQSCLLFSNCLAQSKNAHVYEKLMKKNSEFYLDLDNTESKSLGCSMSENNNESLNESKSCTTVKRCSSEPIYDLPCVTKKNQFKTFGKFNPNIEFFVKNKSEEGLHYMCTDVVKHVPVLSSFSSNFGCSKNPEIERLTPNVDSKAKFADIKHKFNNMDRTVEEKKPVRKSVENIKITNEDIEKSNEPLRPQLVESSPESDSDSALVSANHTSLSIDKDLKSDVRDNRSDSDAAVDLSQMTAKRKIYLSRVSSQLFNPSPYWKCIDKNSCTHLFECCMIVGLTLCESKKNVPYIKSIFPPDVKPPPLIESLCFPDASHWPPSSENQKPEEQYYSLVVTNEKGERKFGYCRRVLPEGGHFCLPLTYCIISPHRANGFFYKVLEELESRHGSPGIENFIKQLYESQFPGPGERLKLKEILEVAARTTPPNSDGYASSTLLRRPCDVRLEEKDLNQLLEHLQLTNFIQVFSSLLHERKVLLLSNSLRKLSSCIEALHSILLPFLWQHTYIPVLPAHLIEMCEAPTPYVIGLLKSKSVEESLTSLNFEDGILVDLDESKILKCCGDEETILPPKFIRDLKMSLNLAKTTTDLSDCFRNVLISDAFIRFFVQVCGNYSKFIVGLPNGEKVFEKEEFIKSVTSNTAQGFLEWFTETAMFNSFIQERLHGEAEDVLVKLFRFRAMEYSEETMKNSAALLKNYKVINRKVRTFGDKIKDLTSFSK